MVWGIFKTKRGGKRQKVVWVAAEAWSEDGYLMGGRGEEGGLWIFGWLGQGECETVGVGDAGLRPRIDLLWR